MSPATLIMIAAAIAVGSLPPLQAGINATIAGHYGHPLWGALTNTVVASLTLAVAILAVGAPFGARGAFADAPWWSWLGGVLGATMVLSAILLAPRLGAAGYVTATLVGTVVASVTIDHFGLVGFPVRPITALRLCGGILALLGMVLVQKG